MSTWPGHSPCAEATSSTVAPAPSRAARPPEPAPRDRVHPGDEVLLRQPEPFALEPGGRLVVVGGKGAERRPAPARATRWNPLVPPGHAWEQRGRIAGITRERPDLVEGARERHDAVARDPAVRRFDPDDPAQRRRLAASRRVRADRQRRVVGGDRGTTSLIRNARYSRYSEPATFIATAIPGTVATARPGRRPPRGPSAPIPSAVTTWGGPCA